MNKRDKAELMFELYEQKMYHIAFSILHNEWQAEDAVMDAFEKIREYVEVDPEVAEDYLGNYMLQEPIVKKIGEGAGATLAIDSSDGSII